MKKVKHIILSLLFAVLLVLPMGFFASCKDKDKMINLYNTQTKAIEKISLENYIEGVVAGEIENNAPIEALKAQAVLARTFALRFMENSTSKYEGADISSDITEAQAYNPEAINDAIRQAVKATKGQTVKYDNQYINAYFHANSGGKTALAKEGLSLSDDEPAYIKSVSSPEDENTNNFSWTATISKDNILSALREMGISVSSVSSFTVGEKGDSGRAITFIVGGKQVNANTFRIKVGSTKLKSTLISDISLSSSSVTFTGKGYGHGVGLSQEGAKILASQGKNYKEIISFYFNGVTIK